MFARATFRDTARVIAPPISANISANLAQILMPACGLAVIYMLRPHLDIPCAPTYRTPTFLKNYAPTVSCPQPASYTSIINSLSMLIIYVRRCVATDPFLPAARILHFHHELIIYAHYLCSQVRGDRPIPARRPHCDMHADGK